MQLETGDLFVVTRGFKYGVLPNPLYSIFGLTPQKDDDERGYDRSLSCYGQVWRALEVCGDSVAAECVHVNTPFGDSQVGNKLSINISEMEIMTVTEKYLAALKGTINAKTKTQ